MVRIHAFGCSLTAQHRWRHLQGVDTTSYAVPGGSHNMQLVMYGNGRHAETIGRDDIIIWQMTDPRRQAYNVKRQEGCDIKEKRTRTTNNKQHIHRQRNGYVH